MVRARDGIEDGVRAEVGLLSSGGDTHCLEHLHDSRGVIPHCHLELTGVVMVMWYP